ncbi:MAG: ATP-binding protein [Chloroflexi bacterium]|nr:ATP-binding protein [Chloroflexota bacterium]
MTQKQLAVLRNYAPIIVRALVFAGLCLTTLYSYLLFHSLAEVFSIVIACAVFILVWNTRRFIDNNYILFIGIAYLFVAIIDLLHTLAYRGLGVFPGADTNLPTQLWVAARYMQSISLLIAPFTLGRKLSVNAVLAGYAVATSLLLASIFYWNIFPVAFVEGQGLTSFKILSEYIISLILIASGGLLFQHRREFDKTVLQLLAWSIAATVVAELSFTLYVDPYGVANLIGHLLKIVAFYLLYKAVVETGLTKPYDLLFRNLTQKERLLATIFDTDPGALAVVAKPELQFQLVNPAYRALTLDPKIDPVGKRFDEVRYTPEGEQTLPDIARRVLATGDPFDVDRYEERFPDGSTRYFSIHMRRIPWEGEQAVLSTRWETTEQVLAQTKIEENTARIQDLNSRLAANALNLRAIIDEMPEGVIIVDQNARPTMSNKEAHRLFAGHIPLGQDYASTTNLQFHYPDGTPCAPDDLPMVRSARDGEAHTNVELVVRCPEMEERSLLASAAPIRDADGRLTGAVGVFQDITPLKELDRLKDEFLSVAAHEMKTPMASMKGYAQLLLKRAERIPDRGSWVASLRTIDTQVNRLVTLVDQLLDVSRIQMRRLELTPERVDLVALVREAVAEAQVTTGRHDIEVHAAVPELYGRWDHNRLAQVLANLLSNAIKYSPDGGHIDVAVTQQDEEAFVSVRDEGIGIPPEAQPHLFERYFRAGSSARSQPEGMGLGLYVTRGIVNAHRGRIWVESGPGKGTTFYFSLPLAAGDESAV